MGSTFISGVSHYRAIDLANLRERVLTPVSFLLILVGGVGAWLYLPGEVFRWQQFTVFLAISALGTAVWSLQRLSVLLAGIALFLGECLLSVVAAMLLPPPVAPLLLEIAVISAVTLVLPWAPIVAAIGSSIALWLIHTMVAAQGLPALFVLVYGTTAAILCFSANSSHQILLWSWRRHVDALRLAEELRDRQQQLNRTVKALDLAYRLLQRTNHELAIAQEEAEQARHLKEQFSASISHELRTPLNLILGFSEMMYMSPHVYGDVNWTEPLRRDVAQIYTASRHLSQLVDDVLDLSRLNAERMPLRKELSDLTQVIEEAVTTARDLIRGRPLTINVELDEHVPPLLLDATRIRQVVLNLLNNAIRFTEEGKITVRLQRLRREVLISVSDTGLGIPQSELENIFDEFYQAEAIAGKPSGGIGLGLAISKQFVQMHGGRIWAESTLGHGSTFYVSLPTDASRPLASRLRTSSPAPRPENPYAPAIVLLGDQPDVARILERHLDGYTIHTAASADEAERLIQQHHPQAIVRNLSLSEMRALTRQLAPPHLCRHTPLILCTIPCTHWRAEMLGVHACLQKPVQRRELLSLLEKLGDVRDVLVIDDDRGFVQMVARMLAGSNRGFRVRWAYDGTEGLAAMKEQVPDVVLLDLIMPEPGGATLLARMRREPVLRNVPVVVVTAMDVAEDMGVPESSLVSLVHRDNWGVGDTLRALNVLAREARPHYITADRETPVPASALPAPPASG